MLLIVDPLTFVPRAIRCGILAESLSFVVYETSLITNPIEVCHLTLSMSSTVLPLALIVRAIGPYHSALSVSLAIEPLPCVVGFILVSELPCDATIFIGQLIATIVVWTLICPIGPVLAVPTVSLGVIPVLLVLLR